MQSTGAEQLVIGRNTAFTYKGKPVDAKEIGRELGVRYMLEGSVRRVGETIAVNAQLISTETGAHVWADRFDGERSKLGELQVEFVSRLANSLGVELVKAEALRTARERPSNPEAVDLAMQAQDKWNVPDSKAALNDAITLSERALALNPQNVRALTVLTNALLDRVADQWSDDPAGDIARADKAIDAARPFNPVTRGRARRRRLSSSTNGNGDQPSRRPKPRLCSTATTRAPTHGPLFGKCSSVIVRTASRA